MFWNQVQWPVLHRLRKGFLHPSGADYWATEKELEHYDLAFAPRIASKWRAVLTEGSFPRRPVIYDWACGTGIASRTYVEVFGNESQVYLWDRSLRAGEYACARLADQGVQAQIAEPGKVPEDHLLLVSHVWGELDARGQQALRTRLQNAQSFAWVEPGTPESSRALVESREALRSQFKILAPCPHQGPCGLRPQDWCHHFAPAEPSYFQSGEWKHFSDEMKIDLRSLPVSYLVASRKPAVDKNGGRLIGRSRVYKGYAKALVCTPEGVDEQKIRGDKQSLKALEGFSVYLKKTAGPESEPAAKSTQEGES